MNELDEDSASSSSYGKKPDGSKEGSKKKKNSVQEASDEGSKRIKNSTVDSN